LRQLFVGRNYATVAGQGLLLVLVGAAGHGVNLQPRRFLNKALDPVQIVDARQFNQNLVVSQAILLDHGFADTQRVDAVANGLDGLLDGLLLQRRHDQRLHGECETGVAASASYLVLVGILGLQQGTHVAGLLGRYAFHPDDLGLVRRIGLISLRKAEVGRLQFLLDAPHRVVGFGVDRFRHNHLQNQVSAAAQIQAKVYPARHGLHQWLGSLPRPRNPGDPKNAKNENRQHRNNQCNFTVKILLHRPVSLVRYSDQCTVVRTDHCSLPDVRCLLFTAYCL